MNADFGMRNAEWTAARPSPCALRIPHSTLSWHLWIDPTGRPGAENMAVDQALLEEADRTGRAFLRLYRWSPPCLSFGRHEPVLARYDRARIEVLGVAVVRRPTGGRAVWHDQELTYAVAAPVAAFGSLARSYRAIHARLARGLAALGVAAELASPPSGEAALLRSAGACFAQPVGGEVTVGGKKLVGSAQVRQGAAFLQHGSLLLAGSQDLVHRVSRRPAPSPCATTLAAVLGRAVSFEQVADAIVRAWGEPLTSTAFDRPRPPSTAFADPAWTWRR